MIFTSTPQPPPSGNRICALRASIQCELAYTAGLEASNFVVDVSEFGVTILGTANSEASAQAAIAIAIKLSDRPVKSAIIIIKSGSVPALNDLADELGLVRTFNTASFI